jgi:hypothetical protein
LWPPLPDFGRLGILENRLGNFGNRLGIFGNRLGIFGNRLGIFDNRFGIFGGCSDFFGRCGNDTRGAGMLPFSFEWSSEETTGFGVKLGPLLPEAVG